MIMKFLGLGDNAIDYYVNKGVMYPGGNAVNTAAHAALLGHEAAYLGNFGDDEYAGIIQDGLNFAGASCSLCPVVHGSHTKICLYDMIDGERHFLGIDTGKLWSGPVGLTPEILESIGKYELIHSCAYAKIANEVYKLSALPAVFTYDFSEKEKYHTSEYLDLVCSDLDLALFSCSHASRQEIIDFTRIVHRHGARHVLITIGNRGQYFSNGSIGIWNPANYVKARDTTGAGDAFLACFVTQLYGHGWHKGQIMPEEPIRAALRAAAAYSSENCRKEGSFGYRAMKKENC